MKCFRNIGPLVITGLLLFTCHQGVSQGFGRNKPNYETFRFNVKESPHFLLHTYLKNDSLADAFAKQSERWYLLHQKIFKDTIGEKYKNPIILYNNHADFQQTTAISGRIGVGTGGVTEGLRNRVIMPVMELNSQTDHVLGHELVHVFQYRMMKNPQDSISLADMQHIPLWMIEGLAEYMSIGNTDPHTAMWMRDAVQTGDIPTLKQMTRTNEYFPYRYGQAFWSFTTGVFGDTIIVPLLRKTALKGYDQALKELTGFDEKTFSEAWRQNLVAHYRPYIKKQQHAPVGDTLIDEKNAGEINIAPVLSPNGRYVAFLSEKNIFTIDLFLADAKTGEVLKTLSSTVRESHIDDLSYIESAGTWSPHSDRLAFVVFSEGKNMLSIIDVGDGNKSSIVEIPGVPSFSNPVWSPDGESIVVSGVVNGHSDLYRYHLASRKVMQLTDDRYSDIQPQWSPDGHYILFVSDRPAPDRDYRKRSLQLCLLEAESNDITVFDIFYGAENLSPAFAPDGRSIYFLSNRDGFRNLYAYQLYPEKLSQLTDYFTGISGITAYTPALSVARETGDICYTYFSDGKYTLYKAAPADFASRPADPQTVDFTAGTLPLGQRALDIVNTGLADIQAVDTDTAAIKTSLYKPKMGLEYIGNNVGVGISDNSFGTSTALAGGVNLQLGDMLGYHKLFGTIALNGQVHDFGAQAIYLNQRHRINWGVAVSHIPYRYSSLGAKLDTLRIEDDTLQTENIYLDVFRIFEESVNGFLYFPLSTTRRIEFGTGYSFYSFRLDRYNNHYYEGIKIHEHQEKLDAPEGYGLGNTYAAYVFDNSHFGLASPMRGKRHRLEANKVYDELDYHTLRADYRQYIFLNPTAFAFRVLYYGRHGKDAESDRLYPLSFAYPQFTRGNDLDNIQRYSDQDDEAWSINQIFGSRMLVANAEWRIPFTGPEQLAMIKSNILFTELALFIDAGLAWDASSAPVLSFDPESPGQRVPFLSGGLSMRVNLFGQIVIEPYYAFPWRGDGFAQGKFGLNFLPGW